MIDDVNAGVREARDATLADIRQATRLLAEPEMMPVGRPFTNSVPAQRHAVPELFAGLKETRSEVEVLRESLAALEAREAERDELVRSLVEIVMANAELGKQTSLAIKGLRERDALRGGAGT